MTATKTDDEIRTGWTAVGETLLVPDPVDPAKRILGEGVRIVYRRRGTDRKLGVVVDRAVLACDRAEPTPGLEGATGVMTFLEDGVERKIEEEITMVGYEPRWFVVARDSIFGTGPRLTKRFTVSDGAMEDGVFRRVSDIAAAEFAVAVDRGDGV